MSSGPSLAWRTEVSTLPKKLDGVPEANWIQTNPKKGFFAYFRWYSPTKAFFDRSWKMDNIKEIE